MAGKIGSKLLEVLVKAFKSAKGRLPNKQELMALRAKAALKATKGAKAVAKSKSARIGTAGAVGGATAAKVTGKKKKRKK